MIADLIVLQQRLLLNSILQLFSRYCTLSDIGVMSLTFRGHVTSSVTWPLYSP